MEYVGRRKGKLKSKDNYIKVLSSLLADISLPLNYLLTNATSITYSSNIPESSHLLEDVITQPYNNAPSMFNFHNINCTLVEQVLHRKDLSKLFPVETFLLMKENHTDLGFMKLSSGFCGFHDKTLRVECTYISKIQTSSKFLTCAISGYLIKKGVEGERPYCSKQN